jgi:hypothetical protein
MDAISEVGGDVDATVIGTNETINVAKIFNYHRVGDKLYKLYKVQGNYYLMEIQ